MAAAERTRATVALRNARRAVGLVWKTGPALAVLLFGLTLVSGVIPACATFVGKLIVDGALLAMETRAFDDRNSVLGWVLLEGGLIGALLVSNRGLLLARSVLYAKLGFVVSMRLLEKASTLSLAQLEDPMNVELLTYARRDATSRPFSLAGRVLRAIEKVLTLGMIGGLLLGFSPWAVLVLFAAGVPAIALEGRHSGKRYRFYKGKTPEAKERAYYEAMLTSARFAKEVIPSGMARRTLARYRALFTRLHDEDLALHTRRSVWNIALGLVGAGAFYGVYVWIVVRTVSGGLTIGEMTMYVGLFRQGQKAIEALLTTTSGAYEDVLYLEDVHGFLDMKGMRQLEGVDSGSDQAAGLHFEGVSFTYPGRTEAAVDEVDLTVLPGQRVAIVGANGSGKTTLVRLMLGLYAPDSGRVSVEGTDTRAWSARGLGKRFGMIFQNYVKYELTVGANIDASDAGHAEDRDRWAVAAERGLATPVIDALPDGFDTQLGKSRRRGTELSGGQWQRLALARAFFPRDVAWLVLDEPTAALDAQGEADLYEHVLAEADDTGVILITHRLANARLADRILVMDHGRVIEDGSHDELMRRGGRYATLFALQAKGYRDVWASAD